RCTRPRRPAATPTGWPARRAARRGRRPPPADSLTDMPEFPPRSESAPDIERAGHRRAVKAVIPAAGMATRFLPATKAVPKELLGLGHAVSYAESHVGGEPFAVLLGDEFTDESDPLLPDMLDLQARTGGIVLALIEVPDEEVSRYGIASVRPASVPSRAAEVV